MPKHWTSAGGKGLLLKEGQLKVHSGDGQMQLILRGGGIEVSSGGSLTFSGENIGTGQEKAKKVTFSGEEYLFLKQKEEKLLLTEESVEAKGTEIGITSPEENTRCPLLTEDGVAQCLAVDEEAKKQTIPLFAADGSRVKREGYDDVWEQMGIYDYFMNNVYEKEEGYENILGQPVDLFYQSWLDEVYGKTKLGEFWAH